MTMQRRFLACAAACLSLTAGAWADTYNWATDAGGNWSTGWEQEGYPSSPDDVAIIGAAAAPSVITLDVADAVLGVLNISGAESWTIAGANTLTFDTNTLTTVEINVSDGTHTISAPITNASIARLDVTASSGARAILSGVMSGGVASDVLEAVYVTGTVEITANNTYTGITRLHNSNISRL